MNVLIFGATGGIGKWAVKHARERGYNVTVYVRNAAKIKDETLHVVEGEITDYEKMKEAVRGQDAVVWTIGIPLKRDYEGTAATDGHVNLLKAMEETGVRRLVDWGTPSVKFDKDKKSFTTVVPGIAAGLLYTKAKKEMVDIGEMLKQSDLDWTLVRFIAPKDKPFTRKIKVSFGDKTINWIISRADIAYFMINQIEDMTYNKSMPIIGS